MIESYKTIAAEGYAEITEKKSIFIARAVPVSCESEANSVLEGIKKDNANANHNVFAYRVGLKRVDEKYFDGGEPHGTAGLPVLSVMRKEGLLNVMVVVTRFFGGILLGAGGLARAYQASCKAGLNSAGIVTKRLTQVFGVISPYAFSGKIQYDSQFNNYLIKDTAYAENVSFTIYTPFSGAEVFARHINEITNGSAKIIWMECTYT